MNFLTYGEKSKPVVLFIHGMATTARICYEPILKYLENYYVVLVEVDGHSEKCHELKSLAGNCDEIERYIIENLDGKLFCLSGFSMGATMAVELAGRGHINITKLHLDAAFLIKMGVLTKPYEWMFGSAISWIKKGGRIPKFLMDAIMGKDNNSVVEMLYPEITSKTLINVCEFVYRYDIPEQIAIYRGSAVFWYGENEAYPRKSAQLLKKYLPNMQIEEFANMGHGQYLHEHSDEYAMRLIDYLQG